MRPERGWPPWAHAARWQLPLPGWDETLGYLRAGLSDTLMLLRDAPASSATSPTVVAAYPCSSMRRPADATTAAWLRADAA